MHTKNIHEQAVCICADSDPFGIGHDDTCVRYYLEVWADHDTRTTDDEVIRWY